MTTDASHTGQFPLIPAMVETVLFYTPDATHFGWGLPTAMMPRSGVYEDDAAAIKALRECKQQCDYIYRLQGSAAVCIDTPHEASDRALTKAQEAADERRRRSGT